MASLPPLTPRALRDLQTRRLSRVDGCPRACGNYELPTAVIDGVTGFTASYTCGVCRRSWITNWSDE